MVVYPVQYYYVLTSKVVTTASQKVNHRRDIHCTDLTISIT
jgi:hypothetical protein